MKKVKKGKYVSNNMKVTKYTLEATHDDMISLFEGVKLWVEHAVKEDKDYNWPFHPLSEFKDEIALLEELSRKAGVGFTRSDPFERYDSAEEWILAIYEQAKHPDENT